MAGYGTAPLDAIAEMLAACAPDRKVVEGAHRWRVYRGKLFATLPFGKHGTRENPDIELGHVRHLIRALGISPDCAELHLPQLKGKLGKR